MSRALGCNVVVAIALAACQGNHGGGGTGSGSAPSRDGSGVLDDAALASVDAALDDADVALVVDDAGKPDEPEAPPEPGKVIAELGAIPAWQAVVDRAQLLGRRGQHGVVYGRIGPAVMVPAPPEPEPEPAGSGSGSAVPRPPPRPGPPPPVKMIPSSFVWLVDDTDGNGSLGIRVALGTKTAKQGDRVALGGAWQLDEARRWYWKVDSLQSVPPAPPSDLKEPQPPEPSHVVRDGGLIPGSRTITVGRDNDAVYFQIVGPPPANEGDGWLVADELGDKPYAFLTLPGERPSYGGQDMRADDERWQLKRAQTYVVRIGRIRKRDGKPALIHARTAPIRVN